MLAVWQSCRHPYWGNPGPHPFCHRLSFSQGAFAGRFDAVEPLRLAASLGCRLAKFGCDEPLLLQAIECRVNGAEADRLSSAPLDFIGDGDPVAPPSKMNDGE